MLRKTLFIAFTALLVTSCGLKNITSAEDIKAHIIAFGIYELDGAYSGPFRSLILDLSDHPYWFYSIIDSGFIRSFFPDFQNR